MLKPSVLVVIASFLLVPLASADDALPAAPTFDGWAVKSDEVVPAKKVEQVAKKLGAKISALRNTVYDVKGNKVQVNVMVAPDSAEADKLAASLGKTKASWSLVRKGTTLYEFVGQNKTDDEIKRAGATLGAAN